MGKKDRICITKIEKRLKEIQMEKERLLQAASEIKDSFLSSYEIRPASRHVITIGEDLIQDQYAAIVELVKNSYDADSPDVIIAFRKIVQDDCLEIQVKDHGHGMSPDDIINRWLVPSTDYKLRARKSPNGRIMQGRKGIGRYAASILGNDLNIETIDVYGNETNLYIDWNDLKKYQYLDQIRIPIKTQKTNKESGTVLTIHSRLSENDYWKDSKLDKLRFELKKLMPQKTENMVDDEFKVVLKFIDFFSEQNNINEIIKPYPILDFYDYRISGEICSSGKGILKYENNKMKNTPVENVFFDNGTDTGCGAIKIDIRVYDRDKESINQLIARGLQDEHGAYVSSLQARQLLNDVNGVGVYRNGFRIRPLGDADFDWLKLNERRIQKPSLRISSNQVVGYVHIQSEDESGLEEKSARDGLKDNNAYKALKNITTKVIKELEERRYFIRRKISLSDPRKKIEEKIDGLYDYTDLEKVVSITLRNAGVHKDVLEKVSDSILKEENKKNKTIEEIKHAVAVYQGQATLGKIVNIIMHEGRRPLNYFKNQIPNLIFYLSKLKESNSGDYIDDVLRLINGISDNAKMFVNLFGRLDPLSAKRREIKKEFSLYEVLCGAANVFYKECLDNEIQINIECSKDIKFIGWKQDVYTILVNLIDNSIFWLIERTCSERNVNIIVREREHGFTLDYTDSGPGISDDFIESGVIFDPEFTTKTNGTGLGLAIAGEAATRNDLELIAVQRETGAHFILSTVK